MAPGIAIYTSLRSPPISFLAYPLNLSKRNYYGAEECSFSLA
jgi:hypothetical protein